MSALSRELVFLILQFLDEEKYKHTVHSLEQESGLYFNMRHFDEMVMNGDLDDVEKYLFGFTKVDDNRYSMKIFFEIRKQKYLEALDKKDRTTAVEILVKDLRLFSTFNEDLIKEMTQLLVLDNFRENEQLSRYTDAQNARSIMLIELKKLIEANPLFRDKLNFPALKNSRLRTLINQSLNWQHQLCKVPKPNPDIRSLFVDHTCGNSQLNNGSRAPSPVPNALMGVSPRPGGFSPLNALVPFQPAPGAMPGSLAGWMTSAPPYVSHPTASAGPVNFNLQTANAGPLKHSRTSTNSMALDYQSADSEKVVKRSRTFSLPDEVNNAHVNIMPAGLSNQGHRQGSSFSFDDLPKTVLMNLNQGSNVRSMDFHPVQQSLLVVGTISGETMIWDLLGRNRICHKSFKVWDLRACSMVLQTSLDNDYSGCVNRVLWSPDGSLCAVAYSKHIVQLYSYHGADDLRNHLEIEAHVGSVNDLAFSVPSKLLCIITCGEDRLIKVWDTVSGSKQYTFEGHEAPVHSICPHYKDYIQFIFATATDGKIKAWLYDNQGSRLDYEAPGRSTTTMAYSGDGKRLFSCGTNKEGNSYLVEWNETEGAVKRTYSGLCKRAEAIVQFDTTNNRILAVGDDFKIKFWDMDNVNLLATTDADGGLHASPCVRFNKEGALLAVSTSENGIKILASADGVRLLQAMENTAFDASRLTSDKIVKPPSCSGAVNATTAGSSLVERVTPVALVAMNMENRGLIDSKLRVADEPSVEKSRTWKMTEVNEASQCRSLRLPDTSTIMRVTNLTYMNNGFGILALACNAVHKLWKWPKNEENPTGQANANVAPQLWQPSSGILMMNGIRDANLEDAVPCFALSKNDSYVMSASGGKISLFNMMTFKTMTTFMAPPPAATFLTFHPKDSNIIAVGMGDSSIQIYNVRLDEVKVKLDGHQKRITGLAFSNALNVLVSSGADSQLCVWSTDSWEKQTSKYIQRPPGRVTAPVADTCVQFHQDQTHLLVVHETQIAIYEAPKLVCLKQWVPLEASGPITYATYSCDSESIYVSFEDGSVGVLTASTLRLRCRINPSSYMPAISSVKVYPLVVAAHPTEPNQFALGLSDGGVCVLEPLESEGRWGSLPPLDNASTGPSISTSDQQHHQR